MGRVARAAFLCTGHRRGRGRVNPTMTGSDESSLQISVLKTTAGSRINLHSHGRTWYEWNMNDSWIALTDQHGLRQLTLETRHAVRFLLRRAARENAECFWVVLTPTQARFIQQWLQMGDPLTALRMLDDMATDSGRISPDLSLIPASLAEYVTIPDGHDKEWGC